jgi:enoyl-CoA hydratase/carnithine racemase
MTDAGFREIAFEVVDRVAVLTLNRPDSRNLISHEAMIAEIEAACARVNADTGISCLVITAAGTAFSAGGNVKDMADRADMFGGSPVEVARGYRHGIQRIPLAIDAVEVPTVCAVNGPAIGAGCDLVFMCDLRIASEHARFGETFVNLGIVPGDGGAYFLPRAIGPQKAAEMIFTGRVIDAQEALAAGLVLTVVPAAQLRETAMALAVEIARKPPHASRLAKLLYRQGLRATNLRDFLDTCAAFQALCHHTEDHVEAVRALLEKRPGTFRGH